MAITSLKMESTSLSVGGHLVDNTSTILHKKIYEFINSEEFKTAHAAGGKFKFKLENKKLIVLKENASGEFEEVPGLNTGEITKSAQTFASLYSKTYTCGLQEAQGEAKKANEKLKASSILIRNIGSLSRLCKQALPRLTEREPQTTDDIRGHLPTRLSDRKITTTSILEKALERKKVTQTTVAFEGLEGANLEAAKKKYPQFFNSEDEKPFITLEPQENFNDIMNGYLSSTQRVQLTRRKPYHLRSEVSFEGDVTRKRTFTKLERLYIKIPRNPNAFQEIENVPLKISQGEETVALKGFIAYEHNQYVTYYKQMNIETGKDVWYRNQGDSLDPCADISDRLKYATDLYYDNEVNTFANDEVHVQTYEIAPRA